MVPCQWSKKKLTHVSLGFLRVRLPGSLLRFPANMEVEALGVCCQASCDLVSSTRCAKTVTVSDLPWTIKLGFAGYSVGPCGSQTFEESQIVLLSLGFEVLWDQV